MARSESRRSHQVSSCEEEDLRSSGEVTRAGDETDLDRRQLLTDRREIVRVKRRLQRRVGR